MKTKLYLSIALLAVIMPVRADEVRMLTPHNALVIEATQGKAPQTIYYESREAISTPPLREVGRGLYPTYGVNTAGETALAVTHADGSLTTQLAFVSTETHAEPHATVTVLHQKDTLYPFYVDLYTVHELNSIDNEPLAFEGKQFSGRYLIEHGLEIPYTNNVD